MYFYIEAKKDPENIQEKYHYVFFQENAAAIDVYKEYLRLCNSGDYGWLCLRQFNGLYHGLIAEFWQRDVKPFWYTTYFEYKSFAESLGFLPDRVS